MSNQSWQETHAATQTDGTALSNTVSVTTILGASGAGAAPAKFSFPPGFWLPGKVLKVTAAGRITHPVTPGTLTLSLNFNSGSIANGGAMALNAAAKTNVPWLLNWYLTARINGSNLNFMHQGFWESEAVVGSAAGTAGTILLPATAPAVGGTFDPASAQQIDLLAQWSVAAATYSIQVHQFMPQSLN